MYFRKYWLPNIWSDKCLKSPVSEDSETSNMANSSKSFCNLNGSTLQYLLITVKIVVLEKVAFRNTKIPKTVC